MDIINMLPNYLTACLKDFMHFLGPYSSIIIGGLVFVVVAKKLLSKF